MGARGQYAILAAVLLIALSSVVYALWPSEWTQLKSDANDLAAGNAYRDVLDTFYALDPDYFYFRMELAGSPSVSQGGDVAHYKWFIDMEADTVTSTTKVEGYEYLLVTSNQDSNCEAKTYILGPTQLKPSDELLCSNAADPADAGYRVVEEIDGDGVTHYYLDMYISFSAMSEEVPKGVLWAVSKGDNRNLNSHDQGGTDWDDEGISDIKEDRPFLPILVVTADKIAEPTSGFPGDTITFTITVTNEGNVPLDVTVEDALPAGLIYISADPSPALSDPYAWTFEDVEVDGIRTITLTTTIAEGATGDIINTAIPSGVSNDGDPAAASGGSAIVTVLEKATIVVRKNVLNPDDDEVSDSYEFTVQLDGVNDKIIAEGIDATYEVNPGTYTITEVADADYDSVLYSLDEDPETPGAQITVSTGDVVDVTITNKQKKATLTIIKDVRGPDGEDVVDDHEFEITLSDGQTGTVSENSPTVFSVNPGTLSAVEMPESGYVIVGYDPAEIILTSNGAGEIAITNRQQPTTLTVTKLVLNDNGGLKTKDDFTLLINGDEFSWGTAHSFSPGTYVVSEVADSGYGATIGGDCAPDGTITLERGDVKSCTIMNDDIQPLLTVTKIMNNNNGGTKAVDDFSLFVGATQVVSEVQNRFNAGTYAISETGPDGYSATFSGDCDSEGTIVLEIGRTYECIITNDDTSASITLFKAVISNPVLGAISEDFILLVDGSEVRTGNTAEVDANTPIAIDEVGLEGYKFVSITGDAKCPDVLGGTVTLDEGEDITCTITNDEKGSVTDTEDGDASISITASRDGAEGTSFVYDSTPVSVLCETTNPEVPIELVSLSLTGTGPVPNPHGITNAGTYVYSCTTPETENYLAGETSATITIEKAPVTDDPDDGEATVMIVSSRGNEFTYDGLPAEVECTTDNPEVPIELVSLSLTGTGPVANPHEATNAGTYAYTCTTPETANYLSGSASLTVIINKAPVTDDGSGGEDFATIGITSSRGTEFMYDGISTEVLCRTTNTEAEPVLMLYDEIADNPDFAVYTGIYSYTCETPETENYEAGFAELTVTINKAASSATLTLNSDENNITVDFGTEVSAEGFCRDVNGDIFGTSSLTRTNEDDLEDMVVIDSETGSVSDVTNTAELGIGSYAYELSCSGDGNHLPSSASYTLSVVNSPPAIDEGGVTIEPEDAYTSDDLVCRAAATDADGDEITFSYQWYLGVETGFDNETNTTIYNWTVMENQTSHILSAELTQKDYAYRCEATPNDGVNDGEPGTSNPIVILNSPPVADAGEDKAGFTTDTFTFSGAGSTDPDGKDDIVLYVWDFGDGTTGNGETIQHAYSAPISYIVTLTVTDASGESSSDSIAARISSPPSPPSSGGGGGGSGASIIRPVKETTAAETEDTGSTGVTGGSDEVTVITVDIQATPFAFVGDEVAIQVMSADDGTPFANEHVSVSTLDGDMFDLVTDSSGAASFIALKEGTYVYDTEYSERDNTATEVVEYVEQSVQPPLTGFIIGDAASLWALLLLLLAGGAYYVKKKGLI